MGLSEGVHGSHAEHYPVHCSRKNTTKGFGYKLETLWIYRFFTRNGTKVAYITRTEKLCWKSPAAKFRLRHTEVTGCLLHRLSARWKIVPKCARVHRAPFKPLKNGLPSHDALCLGLTVPSLVILPPELCKLQRLLYNIKSLYVCFWYSGRQAPPFDSVEGTKVYSENMLHLRPSLLVSGQDPCLQVWNAAYAQSPAIRGNWEQSKHSDHGYIRYMHYLNTCDEWILGHKIPRTLFHSVNSLGQGVIYVAETTSPTQFSSSYHYASLCPGFNGTLKRRCPSIAVDYVVFVLGLVVQHHRTKNLSK